MPGCCNHQPVSLTLQAVFHHMNFRLLIFIFSFALGALLSSCENDIEKINLFTGDNNDYPDIVGENIEVIYSDSARVKVQMHAKELKQYNNADEPYSEFPEGIIVYFYDDFQQIESEMHADYAIYHNEEKMWFAKGNVIVKNLKTAERLDTEELYWDEEKEKIYSNTFSRIENENGINYCHGGFKSDQTFKNVQLIDVQNSIINIEEDE